MRQRDARLFGACVLSLALVTLHAQTVTKETVPGITNFAREGVTIACAGATAPSAIAELKKMGFASVIDLRVATETGADIEGETAAAKAAGITLVHIPFNEASPAPTVVPDFLAAVTAKQNQPVFVHCASGNRAATLWMIKRMMVDKWDADRAGTEAEALGMTKPTLKTFALDYVQAHR